MLQELGDFFGAEGRFRVRLEAIAGFPGVVYLVPDPRERFVELINALVRLYPHVPPYGGRFGSVIPHLTLGESDDPEIQDLLVASVAGVLPIESEAADVWLMVRQGRRWKTIARFALASSGDARRANRELHETVAW